MSGMLQTSFRRVSGKVSAAHGVLFKEQHDAVHRLRQRVMKVDMVKDSRLVRAHEATALHPGIGEVLGALLAKQQHRALGRHNLP
jgi:hypothetical protein